MSAGSLILLVNAASTLALTGLIWTIQLVHYPAFRFVSPANFAEFEAFHQRRITWVVAPLMLMELGSALGLVLWRPPALPVQFAVTGALLVLAVWLCTFAVQVPLHNRLNGGQDDTAITALIHTNWIRTALWTLRAGLLLWAAACTGMGLEYLP